MPLRGEAGIGKTALLDHAARSAADLRPGFAKRARRELLATGATVRKRTVATAVALTRQELEIARLAREGLSNPEISTRLFISPRTATTCRSPHGRPCRFDAES